MAWIPAVISLIGAAAQYKSSRDANKIAGRIGDQQQRLYGIQADQLEKTAPYTLDFYRRAKESFDPAFKHYRTIAGGDRQAIAASLAPEREGIASRYRSMIEAHRALNPRGGAGAAFNADLTFRAMDDDQEMVSRARQNAIAQLMGLSGLAGNIASGAGSLVNQGIQGGQGLLSDQFNLKSAAAAQQQKAYEAIADALMKAYDYKTGKG